MCLKYNHFFRASPSQQEFEMDADAELLMRERRPTSLNKDEMLDLMTRTRDARRMWITNSHPDETTILLRFPRLGDMMDAVSVLYLNMHGFTFLIFRLTVCFMGLDKS
jgi:hypothetical protein